MFHYVCKDADDALAMAIRAYDYGIKCSIHFDPGINGFFFVAYKEDNDQHSIAWLIANWTLI